MPGEPNSTRHAGQSLTRLLSVGVVLAIACGSSDPAGPGSGRGGSPAERAASIQTVFGGAQIGDVARPLAEPLGARVSDLDGLPVAGVTVTWRVTVGGGAFEPATSVTDSFGFTQTVWTLSTAAGAARAEAVVGDLEPAVYTATARPGPVGSLRIDPFDRSVILPDQVIQYIAFAADSFGNVVNDAGLVWTTTDEAVAVVDPGGRAVGRGLGQTFVRAEVDGVIATAEVWVLERSELDRPDQEAGPQIHFIYAVPIGRSDRSLDFDGRINNAILAIQNWLTGETNGRQLRIDTFRGLPDVSFVPLALDDAVVAAQGAAGFGTIVLAIAARGFSNPDKIYAVFYDGDNRSACANAAWPPQVPGQYAIQYLRGREGRCIGEFARSPEAPIAFRESVMIHEILHAMGFVDPNAPNAVGAHVADDLRDVLVGGVPSRFPPFLDVGRDDYFGSNLPAGVKNLADSPFLAP